MSEDTLGTCDRGASERAAVRVKMPSGYELEMCAHHFDANADALLAAGAEVTVDHREALYTKV